jgi:hypothetical protein
MIEASKFSRALDGADVGGLLHDADQRRITAWIAADGAELRLGEIEAPLARMYALAERNECLG